jgi:hypothetical protein
VVWVLLRYLRVGGTIYGTIPVEYPALRISRRYYWSGLVYPGLLNTTAFIGAGSLGNRSVSNGASVVWNLHLKYFGFW